MAAFLTYQQKLKFKIKYTFNEDQDISFTSKVYVKSIASLYFT